MSGAALLKKARPGADVAAQEYPKALAKPALAAGAAETRTERRADKRYPVSWRGVIRVQAKATNVAYQGKIVDVSLSSCQLALDNNIHAKQQVSIFLELPRAHPGEATSIIAASGQIIRVSLSSKYGAFIASIRFDDFKGDSRVALLSHIESLAM